MLKPRDLVAIAIQRLAWRLENLAEKLHGVANPLFTYEASEEGVSSPSPEQVTKRALAILHQKLKGHGASNAPGDTLRITLPGGNKASFTPEEMKLSVSEYATKISKTNARVGAR